MNTLSRYITEEMQRQGLGFVRISGASPSLGLPVRITEHSHEWTEEQHAIAADILATSQNDYEIETYRQSAIKEAREVTAQEGIAITYGITTDGEPVSVRLWCRHETDYNNYGTFSHQLREADEYGFADRSYRISTMDGALEANRATWRFILIHYMEKAQMLYEAII